MKKEEFLRRKNELKEKLRDTYIIVDEGIGCSLAMGCYFDHQVNKWKVFENVDNIIYKNDTGVKVISKKDYFAKLNKIIKQ
ncbi:hypothetical protein [Jutongia sp.]